VLVWLGGVAGKVVVLLAGTEGWIGLDAGVWGRVCVFPLTQIWARIGWLKVGFMVCTSVLVLGCRY
jgi:hypothetical protein